MIKLRIEINQVCVGNRCRSVPHSANTLLNQHWATRRKWKLAWQEQIRYNDNKAWWKGWTGANRPTVYITFHTTSPQDQDNSMASAKYLIDALVKENVLEDDSPEHCEIKMPVTIKVKTKKECKTVIEVE